ncbi:proenkephalin-B [Salminus brasiliensis]|uniref:proenkephalin-B n=1 Tax=Salminus brasiliensis TaxID=930266 RepID=UPI003B838E6B
MEWCVLVLVLTLPSLSQAGCSEQCLRCVQQISDQNSPISELNSPLSQLTCALECEGALQPDECEEALQVLSEDLKESRRRGEGEGEEEEGEEEEDEDEDAELNLVKRYGGFIKRLEKNRNKLWPWRENSLQKGQQVEKQRDSTLKLLEGSSKHAGAYGRLEKRYGGFRRKFGPKTRSSPLDPGSQEQQQELQKRYGGFMRRIRPKLKWDNQKRYGGFLRRHFKISVRSEEEPSLEDQLGPLK